MFKLLFFAINNFGAIGSFRLSAMRCIFRCWPLSYSGEVFSGKAGSEWILNEYKNCILKWLVIQKFLFRISTGIKFLSHQKSVKWQRNKNYYFRRHCWQQFWLLLWGRFSGWPNDRKLFRVLGVLFSTLK